MKFRRALYAARHITSTQSPAYAPAVKKIGKDALYVSGVQGHQPNDRRRKSG
jgi:hypothetical protein